jgi:hypothetical protein
MQFIVGGTHRTSGIKCQTIIEALSVNEAKAQAARQGFVVFSCDVYRGDKPPAPRPSLLLTAKEIEPIGKIVLGTAAAIGIGWLVETGSWKRFLMGMLGGVILTGSFASGAIGIVIIRALLSRFVFNVPPDKVAKSARIGIRVILILWIAVVVTFGVMYAMSAN